MSEAVASGQHLFDRFGARRQNGHFARAF